MAQTQSKKHWGWFWFKALATLGVLLLIMYWFSQRFTIGIDPQSQTSIQQGDTEARVFLVDNKVMPDKGDLSAIFLPMEGVALLNLAEQKLAADKLVKRVVGVKGDHIRVTKEGTYVNGKKVAEGLALAKTLKMDPRIFQRELVVPENELFVVGDTANSFDSRYWGTVKSPLGKVRVIF